MCVCVCTLKFDAFTAIRETCLSVTSKYIFPVDKSAKINRDSCNRLSDCSVHYMFAEHCAGLAI